VKELNSALNAAAESNPFAERVNPSFLAGGGEMGARMRALDWNATPLGDPASWPQSLKTIVRVMLDSRHAMWMLWGPELTFLCNDAYLPTVGIKRDWVLGARSDEVWKEIWPDIGPRIARVLEHGQATWDEGLLLFLERRGFKEETYHTFSYSPVYGDDGRIAGMLCVVTEVTRRVQDERGLGVLRDLASRIAGAQSVREVCTRLMAVLGEDPADVPFACLYVLDQDEAWLAGNCGSLPAARLPERTLIRSADAPWPLAKAIESGEPQWIELPDGAESTRSRLWPDRVAQAYIAPMTLAQSGAAVLVAGVSPRRPLDEAYRRFFDLLAAQFAAAVNDAQARETEHRRAQVLSELARELLEARPRSAGPDEDQGATVEIQLPLVDPVQADRESTLSKGSLATRILIVDDNHDAAESLGFLLSLEGHEVHSVHAAREVLESARRFKPHIILLDIGLPEVNGFEVARRLRAASEFSGVKIVALTGYGQTEDTRRTEAAGFDAHLVKPADLATLQQTLDRLT
jgi:CheY-like chemotaxis protein